MLALDHGSSVLIRSTFQVTMELLIAIESVVLKQKGLGCAHLPDLAVRSPPVAKARSQPSGACRMKRELQGSRGWKVYRLSFEPKNTP